MLVCVCVYARVCECVCVNPCVRDYMRVWLYACVTVCMMMWDMRVYECVIMWVHVNMCVCVITCVRMGLCVSMIVHVSVCSYARVCACVIACVYAFSYLFCRVQIIEDADSELELLISNNRVRQIQRNVEILKCSQLKRKEANIFKMFFGWSNHLRKHWHWIHWLTYILLQANL